MFRIFKGEGVDDLVMASSPSNSSLTSQLAARFAVRPPPLPIQTSFFFLFLDVGDSRLVFVAVAVAIVERRGSRSTRTWARCWCLSTPTNIYPSLGTAPNRARGGDR